MTMPAVGVGVVDDGKDMAFLLVTDNLDLSYVDSIPISKPVSVFRILRQIDDYRIWGWSNDDFYWVHIEDYAQKALVEWSDVFELILSLNSNGQRDYVDVLVNQGLCAEQMYSAVLKYKYQTAFLGTVELEKTHVLEPFDLYYTQDQVQHQVLKSYRVWPAALNCDYRSLTSELTGPLVVMDVDFCASDVRTQFANKSSGSILLLYHQKLSCSVLQSSQFAQELNISALILVWYSADFYFPGFNAQEKLSIPVMGMPRDVAKSFVDRFNHSTGLVTIRGVWRQLWSGPPLEDNQLVTAVKQGETFKEFGSEWWEYLLAGPLYNYNFLYKDHQVFWWK